MNIKRIENKFKELIEKYGENNEVNAFRIMLDDTIIKRVAIHQDGTILFYYGENENDFETIEGFSNNGLDMFYNSLKNALIDEFGVDLKVYYGEYDDEYLDEHGLEIVCWPDIQDLMEKDGFNDHAYLINDEYGLDAYGSSAYVVEKYWANN